MKNFACLILGMGLLVNATMANLNENDAIDRVKRGSLNWKNGKIENISAAKKKFIVAQIKKLGGLSDGDRVSVSLSNALKKKFGGRWMVLACEKDEICSFSLGGMPVQGKLRGWYGQTYWAVYKV